MTCEELHQAAAELALGVLNGEERARALAHMDHCVSCRALVDDMTQVSDALLTLAPEHEPPLGFEVAVAERMGIPVPARRGRSRRRTRRLLATGGAALAGVAAAAAGLVFGLGGAQAPAGHALAKAAAPASARTVSFRQASFVAQGGASVGRVMLHSGRPPWMFVTVDQHGVNGWVTCYVATAGGTVRVGRFDVYEGHGSWGAATSVTPSAVEGAKLVADDGGLVASAKF